MRNGASLLLVGFYKPLNLPPSALDRTPAMPYLSIAAKTKFSPVLSRVFLPQKYLSKSAAFFLQFGTGTTFLNSHYPTHFSKNDHTSIVAKNLELFILYLYSPLRKLDSDFRLPQFEAFRNSRLPRES